MDPNLFRHMEYFTVPNNQTNKPTDRAASLTRSTGTGQPYPLWNPSTLGADLGPAFLQPTSQAAMSFEAFQQAQTQANGNISFEPQRSGYSPQGRRAVLPTRTPKPANDRHERKRSKLSTEATPFDSVDYWLQFDNDDTTKGGTAGESAGAADQQQPGSAKATETERSSKQAAPSQTPTQPTAPSQQTKADDGVDDSALDNALSDDEDNYSSINLADQLSKIDSVAPSEVPQREGLYSTPLSWERPQPGLRMDSVLSTQNQLTLDQAEQQRLIAIAMNTGGSGGLGSSMASQYPPYNTGLGSAMGGFGLGTASLSQILNMPPQPPTIGPMATYPPQKSRPSEKGKEKAGKGDRTAHNDIERKYRTNLKDKIAELRDAVPALRTIPENDVEDGEEGGQPSRGPKVSKGAVLTKATEYIQYLEKKNKAIMQQHQELAKRLQAFEQLLSASARPTYQMPNYSRTLFDPRGFC